MLRRLIVKRSFEQQDVWLWLMNFVVFPSQTLRDSKRSPLLFPQKLQRLANAVKVFFGYNLEHLLRELNMTVFVIFVRVTTGVVDGVSELIQLRALGLTKGTRPLVPPCHVDIHEVAVLGHDDDGIRGSCVEKGPLSADSKQQRRVR